MTNRRSKNVPTLQGEELYIPFVGAIIERDTSSGVRQILIQTRTNKSNPEYIGTIEVPGGKIQAFEDVYDAVCREIREETALEVTFIQGRDQRIDHKNREGVSSVFEPFCVSQMKNGPFIGFIFLCQAVGQPALLTEETENARWINVDELKEIVTKIPEKIYTVFLGGLKKYLASV